MLKRTTLLAAAAGLAMVPAARGTVVSWANSAGGFYSTPANWTGGVIPGSADEAVFNRSAAYPVNFTSNISNVEARIGNDSVTLNLAAKTYTLTDTAATSLSIGGGTSIIGHGQGAEIGVLVLASATAGGALHTQSTEIGGPGTLGSGRVVVNSNVTWTSAGVIDIGGACAGTLVVQGGGDIAGFMGVVGDGAAGTATVTGSGSTWVSSSSLDIGPSATGTLNVQAGGHVTDAVATLGLGAGKTGTANVDGANSLWQTTGLFTVGVNGAGVLAVTNGGHVSGGGGANACTVADGIGSQGTLTISGTGSQVLLNSGPCQIGHQGAANVTVQSGAFFDFAGTALFGSTSFGSATVGVTGTNSRVSAGAMFVGGGLSAAGGPATISIGTGSNLLLPTGGVLKIWGPGAVNLNGGLIQLGTLSLAGGTLNWNAGTLQFTGGLSISPAGPLGGSPTILAQHTLHAVGFEVDGVPNPSLTISGGSLVSDAGLVVGKTGSAAFNLILGGTASTFGFTLGDQPGATGTASVDGSGSQWAIGAFPDNEDVYVGKSGTGSLSVTSGGVATVAYNIMDVGNDAGSHGTVSVSGTGSRLSYGDYYFMDIGRFGTGTLSVLAGGRVDAPATVAEQPGSVGTITVSGAGSLWTGESVELGNSGAATLTVDNGGNVTLGDLYTTGFPGSSAAISVTGVGSSLTSTAGTGLYGQIIVGGADVATMLVDQGAHAACTESFIGDGTYGVGTVTVRGAGSLFGADELDVAYNGHGTLLVQSGASVSAGAFTAGLLNAAHGEATIDGAGSALNANTIDIGGGELGRLTVSNGAVAHSTGAATIYETGSLALSGGNLAATSLTLTGGSLSGTGTVAAQVVNNGSVSPGGPLGTLSIQGTYSQGNAGALNAEIGGTTPGSQYDQLAVSGPALLNGTLSVSFTGGYLPRGAEVFTVLTASSVAGTFSTMHLPAVPGGSLRVMYGPTSVSIAYCYANCDGSTAPPVLNVNDFVCFMNKYAIGDPYANCDASTVAPTLNVNDFQCFLNKFAAGCM